MNMDIKEQCAESYSRHKHLHNVADEVGIPWQTVYVYLKEKGVPVTGDKSTYGSPKDKLAAHGELLFGRMVPFAVDLNKVKFQPKIDFDVLGYGVDVKTSRRKKTSKRFDSRAWSFSFKKQSQDADFFVCVGLCENQEVEKVFLIPGELVRKLHTVSVPVSMKSKWACFQVDPQELAVFFKSLPARKQAA